MYRLVKTELFFQFFYKVVGNAFCSLIFLFVYIRHTGIDVSGCGGVHTFILCEHILNGAAGGKLDDAEVNQQNAEHCYGYEQEPFDNVVAHSFNPSATRC